MPKQKKVSLENPEERDTYGSDPITRHELESRAYIDDGNRQEETGTHPATGAEDLEQSGSTRQPCATTSKPSSSKKAVSYTHLTLPTILLV